MNDYNFPAVARIGDANQALQILAAAPSELRIRVEKAIATIPPARILPPESGELFATWKDAIERLPCFAFTRGFAVVSRLSEPDRVKYACVYQGD